MQIDISPYDGAPFAGAKLALYLGERLAVILRDAKPGLIFANHWDLPGGGREGDEGPIHCALRECREELGLLVPEGAIVWGRAFPEGTQAKWFFVAQMPESAIGDVVFGNEGQEWRMMEESRFVTHPMAVPAFKDRLKVWIGERDPRL
ncbi:NUDIX hydrolase [Sulfitobacter guttiformis]|uniref:8-oxo-dGTP diphosphatase n=1 Tax=Sulfitobacter guttiformis TaxID=74349 RepID=A0A420DTE8_9RHOB|nr:NUDIX hydrolase [Sulfitobacter guttiformis]KIN74806.1 NUDIX domain protein [Sulfitobacter guttiformis KCTC 32187]RKE97377.1 8-oxo-dGTP diphosphatase [Sulfitobacter guttiformis]